MSDVGIVVIGAGISGLAVAEGLHEAGRSVRVLEARSVAGGRIRTVACRGANIDLGPTWFWPGESRVARLVTSFGLCTHEQWSKGDVLVSTHDEVRRVPGHLGACSYRFSNGASGLVHGLLERLPRDMVTFDCPVHRLKRAEDQIAIHSANGTFSASHVVVAVPPSLALDSGLVDRSELEPQVRDTAREMPVWMGHVVKVVAVFAEPFWRQQGLSGTAISHRGAFSEIHDMSGPEGLPAALFGFSSTALGDPVQTFIAELQALFGSAASDPIATHAADWRKERFTNPGGHPSSHRYDLYGSPHLATPSWNGRLHWASTETSEIAPGHIEGALAAAERTVKRLLD